jgi:uncharacterized phage protein gp47/JayE
VSYGVTASGFVAKTLEEIKADIETAEKDAISASLDVSSASVIGQLNGIFASALREAWELAEAAYHAAYPDSASDDSLTQVASITGTTRRAATSSTLTATVNLNAGVTLPAGSAAHVSGDSTRRFVTTAPVTNGGGSPADVSVPMESEATGPVSANASTLTVIATPVAGWNSVTNPTDATLGTDEESDTDLRLRREQELRASGASTLDAIRADLLKLTGMVDVSVFENTSNVTDGDGRPAKSFEAIIFDGVVPAVSNQTIADQIWASKPAGILAFGTTPIVVTDSVGITHTISFSRATLVTVWFDIDVLVDGADFPIDGDDLIKEKLAQLGDASLEVGEDVIRSQFYAAIFEVPGVVDVTSFETSINGSSWSAANVTIGARDVADLDTSRITINVTTV